MATGTTVETIVNLINTNHNAVYRAIVVLFAEQTSDEQRHEDTKHLNRRGFRADHAKRGSMLAKKIARKELLTPEEFIWAREVLRRYRWQLLIAAAQKSIAQSRPELLPLFELVRTRSIQDAEEEVLDDTLQELGFPDGVNVMKFHRVPLKRKAGTVS
jgi:D-alanyl-D-alanine carboxypeptidase